jgi:epoxyqueuosine reductase
MCEHENRPTARQTSDALLTELAKAELRTRIVPVDRLKVLQESIRARHYGGEFDTTFFEESLTHFDFDPENEEMTARSIMIIAARQPHVRLTFELEGRSWPAIIPPQYSSEIDKRVVQIIEKVLRPAGYGLGRASIPLKLLAVSSGLARYGRNNLTFVDGMGSYLRLMAFFSDLPCPDDPWGELRVLDECEKCTTCARKCPTDAIGDDRFLTRAERCLTFHNERTQAFPAWIDPAWHHCLIGCLYCQSHCPVNRKVPVWIEEGPVFSSKETGLLIDGAEPGAIPLSMRAKLEAIEYWDALPELRRNLMALLEGSGNAARGLQMAGR